jgi:hypothetical protein
MKLDYEGVTIEAFKRNDTTQDYLTITVMRGGEYLSVMHIDLSKKPKTQES